MTNRVLVVGSGNMSKEYVNVLRGLDVEFDVVGRSERGASQFREETGVPVTAGGLKAFVADNDVSVYSHFIVATNVCELYPNTVDLLEAGAKSILVEKPCVLSTEDLRSLVKLSIEQSAEIFIAYNRRFFSSVIRAREIIEEDGGLSLVKFDFTEWAHVIGSLEKDPREKQRWLLANSTHIIDLAFHFAGLPKKLETFNSGELDWHTASRTFAGAGEGKSGALISYGSDWGSASRWWVELFTPKRKLRLCPVETLTETLKGTVVEHPVELNDELDTQYKPGLYRQTESFLTGLSNQLCSIGELSEAFPSYLKIANYE